MTRRLLKNVLFLTLLTLSATLHSSAQSVTGIWRGYFIADDGSQYTLEFQVKQNTTGAFATTGVSYSYADDKQFYGKATMTGNFIKSTRKFRIREIKTVEVKSLMGGGTCIMNYDLDYTKSGKEEFLDGTYLGKQESSNENLYKWGDCGGGKVHLRRVVESEFYVEPFLRPSVAKKSTPPVATPKKNVTKPATPKATPPVAKNTRPQQPVTVPKIQEDKPVVKKTVVPPPSKMTGPVKRADSLKAPEVTAKAPVRITPSTPSVLRNRQNELMKLLVVNSTKVAIKLYDNGEIDDDTISVYFDKRLVLSSKRLTAAALVINVDLDDDSQDHELVLVAENLGRIPPNTSLMVVEAGDKVFNVRITSTEQKNAVVRFRYEKP